MPLGSAVELMSRITCPLPGVVESAPETEMGAGPPLTIRSTAASPANASELALNVPPVAWPSELSGDPAEAPVQQESATGEGGVPRENVRSGQAEAATAREG